MAERRDPSTSGAGGISAAPTDNARYRGNNSPRGGREGGRGGGGVGTSIVLALLIAGLAGAGWFIAKQHQLIDEQQNALTGADDRRSPVSHG